jgi:hypothetical protein
MHLRRMARSRLSEAALPHPSASAVGPSEKGSLVALARRIGVCAVLGMLVTTGMLAAGSFTQTAAAIPVCNQPFPPPACGPPTPHIVQFDANSIVYDTANATITNSNLDQLDRVTNTNQTTVQQSTTISGQRGVTDTQGWSDTFGLKVTVSGGVSIPLIADGKITVEGSASYTHNGSTAEARTFAWQQPVLVPAKSRVVATVAVTRTTIVVPYTMSGTYLYSDGRRQVGSLSGTYSGTNSHDLEVKLVQFDLDGTPAARPVPQAAATLLEIGDGALRSELR